jgi:hypothetical protein
MDAARGLDIHQRWKLTASLKEQASQIQEMSAHLEVSKPAPQVGQQQSVKQRCLQTTAFHNQPSRFASWGAFCFTRVTLTTL